MSITDKDVISSGSQEQIRPTVNQRPNTDARWSFHSGGLFGAPISRGVGSEVYSKLKTALTEIFKSAQNSLEIALIDLDNINEPALVFSSIVVAIRNKTINNGVAYHILLLESTGEKIAPIFENIGNTQVEIMRVTSDAIDDVLITKADAAVRRAFPNEQNYFFTEATVVPSTFNAEDKHQVHMLALNAGLAANTELEIHSMGFKDLDLSNVSNDSSLIVNLGFSRQQSYDAVGAPLRNDIQISFSSKKNNANNRNISVNSGDREAPVSNISAFIDLVWNPVAQQNPYNIYNPMQPMQTQKYSANMVITNLASQMSYTPGSVLLALSTGLSLNMNENWIQAFKPTIGNSRQVDLRDIGALNIEGNLGGVDPNAFGPRINTKEDDFKLQQLGQLVGGLIRPGLMTSLDCPEYGPQSWYLSVFSAAAKGSQSAYKVIYEAAERLTGGRFSKQFPYGTQMFSTVNRIHLGTWIDKDGTKRDIRDIDHLAVCNLVGESNPQIIRDFSDTYLRVNFPEVQRLSARKRMLLSLTNESASFTGFAQRVTFSSAFTDALMKSIAETGLNVRINTPMTGSDFNDQRGVATFANNAVLIPTQSFMNTGPAFMGNFQAPNGMYVNQRWG
jgi:hypothetical protein